MAILTETLRPLIMADLGKLKNPVRLVIFTQEIECPTCRENTELARELKGLSDRVQLQILNFQSDKEQVEKYQIDRIPALVVAGEEDYGIRFYGIATGYEFGSLMDAIKMVGTGESGLSAESKASLAKVTKPVHIKVLVTPTCPYCPAAVRTAHKIAFEAPLVKAEMIEIAEFPQLVNQYAVRGVPKIVINETLQFEGALPEAQFVEQVVKAGR